MSEDRDFDPAPDPDRVETLRETARDLQGAGSEAEQLAALLYRISDLYDPDEETTPKEIYINMRTILNVKESGGLQR